MRGKYKKQFATKYKTRLESISDDRLEKVLTRIVEYTTRIEANDQISDERKENVLAQLEALSEMIQDIVDTTETEA